jgi:hypothetical protein
MPTVESESRRLARGSFRLLAESGYIEIITMLSARLYGSGSHKTKRLLNELAAEKKNGEGSVEDPLIITKSMKPEDVEDDAVRDLLAAMQETQWRAMSLYAKFLKTREDENNPSA